MEFIANSDQVIAHFGYWPEFADTTIERFSFDDNGSISLVLRYFDAEQQKRGKVHLEFLGVTDIELSDLLTHNYLDSVEIGADIPHRVHLEACYGLSGTFYSTAITVTAFEA